MQLASTMKTAAPKETTAPDATPSTKDATDQKPNKRRARLVIFIALTLLGAILYSPVRAYIGAAKLLTEISAANGTDNVLCDESRVTIPTSRGDVPGRLFLPRGVKNPPAIVLVHGVQYKGIDEPRLLKFARAVTDQGVAVLTPQVSELADYHVDPKSIETVGGSVEFLKQRMGTSKVGIMGMSFGGGISLLAASDSRFANDVSFVVAVGAHDDLPRVSRFFAHEKTTDAYGVVTTIAPHDYGAMVLVYDRVEDFFPPEDAEAARTATSHWLREERDEARAAAKKMSAPSQAKIENLFQGKWDAVDPELRAEIEKREHDMSAVSPHGNLGGLKARVFILHGEGDTVIPATEASWLAQDVPEGHLARVLVSPAIVHVELDKAPTLSERIALLTFMGEVLEATHE